MLGAAPGAPIFLSSHCDSLHAALLMDLGRWGDAESILTRSRAAFAAAMHTPSWHPDIALADLRVRQGRLAEAEELLLGKDQSIAALGPAARMHLARGDHELARAALSHARVLAAGGDVASAIAALEDAAGLLEPGRLPWLRSTVLIELARLREASGDHAAATLDAAAASAALAQLDVVVPANDGALLARLTGDRAAMSRRTAVLCRDGAWWSATFDGATVRLHDSKGLKYLAALLERAGCECHALDLVDRIEGVDTEGVDRRSIGDAGAVSDSPARAAYRRRVEELRAEAADALAHGRLEAAEAIQGELDELVAQLARAFGLRGRSRVAASAAERARLNVTRSLRTAIAKVSSAMPHAGAALDRRVRTGLYCAYAPDDNDDVRWIVQRGPNKIGMR